VYLLRLDDGRLERLTIDAHATNDRLRWSPTGDQLAFISERDGFSALYVTDCRGSSV